VAHLEELPLFPLHSVLYPYAPMHIHVFEDRYRQLVRHCHEFDLPFGVVLIRNGSDTGEIAEPFMIGTVAKVQAVHEYPDGRLDITITGQRRFRIRRLDEDNPVLVGYVEPVYELEPESDDRLSALTLRAKELFQQWLSRMLARPEFEIDVQFPEDPYVLSLIIANHLPVENSQKQLLLEINDTCDRYSRLIPLLEKQIVETKVATLYKLEKSQVQEWINPN
jgi:Lon protease-like protein